jgi:hypothetical protein
MKKEDYSNFTLGDTMIQDVIDEIIKLIGEEYNIYDDPSLEPAICDTIDYWMKSGQEDIERLASNIKNIIEVTGKVANNILWYLIGIEYKEGRAE